MKIECDEQVNEKSINSQSCTDWEQLATMADNEIDYSDIPALDKTFFKRAALYKMNTKARKTASSSRN